MSSPFAWSSEERLSEWLGANFDLRTKRATSFYREASAVDAWEAFAGGYGPVKALVEELDKKAVEALRRDFLAFHEKHRTPAGILMQRPYVITSAIARE